MNGQAVVRIPPKRLRLLAPVCASVVWLAVAGPLSVNIVNALAHGELQALILIPLLIALIVTIPYFALWGAWALLRLVTNLPAVLLTPQGIVNHSIVYHVVLPWEEIESFAQFQPGTNGFKMDTILIHVRDRDRVCAAQQPPTRVLLRVFSAIRPTNISTRATKGTREAVWRELQRYVHTTPSGDRIKFVTI